MADHDPHPELVMPFLPVQSRGGPHDDAAYTAGYEMGLLDAQLVLRPEVLPNYPIHTENREQADLIAMRHGYRAEFAPTEAVEWLQLRIVPTEDDERALNAIAHALLQRFGLIPLSVRYAIARKALATARSDRDPKGGRFRD